jgi:hypothetical protein
VVGSRISHPSAVDNQAVLISPRLQHQVFDPKPVIGAPHLSILQAPVVQCTGDAHFLRGREPDLEVDALLPLWMFGAWTAFGFEGLSDFTMDTSAD